MPSAFNRILQWLRAGYPEGVPDADYIPLLAVLARRLSTEEKHLGGEAGEGGPHLCPGRPVADDQQAPVAALQAGQRRRQFAIGGELVAGPHHADGKQPAWPGIQPVPSREPGADVGPVRHHRRELPEIEKGRQIDQPAPVLGMLDGDGAAEPPDHRLRDSCRRRIRAGGLRVARENPDARRRCELRHGLHHVEQRAATERLLRRQRSVPGRGSGYAVVTVHALLFKVVAEILQKNFPAALRSFTQSEKCVQLPAFNLFLLFRYVGLRDKLPQVNDIGQAIQKKCGRWEAVSSGTAGFLIV